MILVDTSVIVDWPRGKDARLRVVSQFDVVASLRDADSGRGATGLLEIETLPGSAPSC
jgi:hypothetical protein